MAALIVAMAVMAMMMTAAMPVWKQLAQREKEDELVFRGEQNAHAIGMFQRRTANAYPPNLDVLVQQKFLRKKYKDPITNDDFVPIAAEAQAGGGRAGAGRTRPAGRRNSRARGQQPGGRSPAASRAGAVGGIIGVTSKSTDASIRLYKGRSHYNEWAFIYTPPAAAPGAGGATRRERPGGRRARAGPGQNRPGSSAGGGPGRGGRGPGQGPADQARQRSATYRIRSAARQRVDGRGTLFSTTAMGR